LLVVGTALASAGPPQPDEEQRLELERHLAEKRGFRAYKYYTYGQMVKAMKDLEAKYPDFVLVENTQDKYGITSPGTCQDDTGGSTPCKQWYMRISNEKTLNAYTPEVWLSGALHGNERVGPNAVMELAIYMLDHYNTNSWMKRLVDTRAVWIFPTTNAKGYNDNVREENGIDPNRDFAYDQTPDMCMRTWTARGVNEFWKDHLIQRSVTFHAGTVVIGYEWGSTNHNTQPWESPDDMSQAAFGKYMSKYAGPFGGTYPYGRQNDPSIIYPVNGGMEDWGYASSWENNYTNPKPVIECNPTANGGWDPAKTRYNYASHRSANILVETSTNKQPAESSFGTDEDVLNVSGTGDGHIPRNIRLALVIVDGVQPYVEYLKQPPAQAAQGEVVDFDWSVGGAFKTDETQVMWGTDPDPANKSTDKSAVKTGLTRWDAATYNEKVTMPQTPGDYYFTVRARVDQNWKQQGSPQPAVAPQEHVTNARTNPAWYYENAGHKVKGQLDWFSPVVKITVSGQSAPPQVVTNSPPNNQVDVPTGTPVQVTFSKDMDKPSVEGAYSMVPAATGAFAWPDARTVKWTPSPDLQASTQYCYTVAKTAKDTTGLAMAADFKSCFTTAQGNQSVPPRVVTTVPTDGATGVRPDAELVITFSKDIDAASVAAAAANKEFVITPAVPCTAQPCPDKWELLKPTELHYTHPGVNQKFLLGKKYTVTIPKSLKATDNTPMANDHSFSFTVVAPPTLVASSPANGAKDVAVDTSLSITFSKPMIDLSTQGAFTLQPVAAGTFSWNADYTVMTYKPDVSLMGGTKYTYALKNEECFSQDGAWMERDAQGNNFASEFSTKASTEPAPRVAKTVPAAGATKVDLGSKIVITFDRAMDKSTTENAVSSSPAITASASWSPDRTELSYTPSPKLATDTTYTIKVARTAKSAAGVALAEEHVFSFGTGGASGGGPGPEGGSIGAFLASPLGLGLIIALIAMVVLIAVAAMMRGRKRREQAAYQQQQQYGQWGQTQQWDQGQAQGGWPPQ
jgi:hypothetical protein